MTFTYVIIFGNIAGISTDGVPQFLFYLSGITLWSYFSESLNKVSTVFKDNAGMFGKVYFPRAIMPIAITLSNLFKFGIQYVLFLVVWLYLWLSGSAIEPNWFVLMTPLLLIAMALISMGLGMVITSLTTKYRDFTFLLGFGVALFMYITPVVYPTSLFLERFPVKWHWLIFANPLTGIFDLFRYGYLGSGTINTMATLWSFVFSILIYLFGLMVFNKTERSFMDTI
jgi:lipopolysaccharide transport system permease protein